MRNLILATASAIVLGMGGVGMTQAAEPSSVPPVPGSDRPAMSATSHSSQTAATPSQAEIQQAQQQLRARGLYNGPIDGTLGAETRRAIGQFQKKNGLTETANLDQATMHSLLGNSGPGAGSTMPPSSGRKSTAAFMNSAQTGSAASAPVNPNCLLSSNPIQTAQTRFFE